MDTLKVLKKKGKMRILKSHNAEKCKRGSLWDFLTSILLQNKNQKIEKDPLVTLKIFQKKHSAEKQTKRGPFNPVRFCMLR